MRFWELICCLFLFGCTHYTEREYYAHEVKQLNHLMESNIGRPFDLQKFIDMPNEICNQLTWPNRYGKYKSRLKTWNSTQRYDCKLSLVESNDYQLTYTTSYDLFFETYLVIDKKTNIVIKSYVRPTKEILEEQTRKDGISRPAIQYFSRGSR